MANVNIEGTNLLGDDFKDYVNDQINTRQEILGKTNKSTENITWENAKSAYIALASSVDLESVTDYDKNFNPIRKLTTADSNRKVKSLNLPGDPNQYADNFLARNIVLYGGTAYFSNSEKSQAIFGDLPTKYDGNLTPITPSYRYGVSNTKSPLNKSAYGFGGTEMGQTAMPGITSFNIKSKNMGSLREATVTIRANSKEQFGYIDTLYNRIGYTMFLEWGNSIYYNNKGKYIPDPNSEGVYSLLDTFLSGKGQFRGTDKKKRVNIKENPTLFLELIEENRRLSNGNYDAFFGKVKNFRWSFNKNGYYEITLSLISQGDIIESLQIDALTLNSSGSLAAISIDSTPNNKDFTTALSSFISIVSSPNSIRVEEGYELDNIAFRSVIISQSNTIVGYDRFNLLPKVNIIKKYSGSITNVTQSWPPTPDGIPDLNYTRPSHSIGTSEAVPGQNKIPSSFGLFYEEAYYYVRFGDLLDFIKDRLLLYNSEGDNEPILDIDTDTDYNIMYNPGVNVSADPSKLVISVDYIPFSPDTPSNISIENLYFNDSFNPADYGRFGVNIGNHDQLPNVDNPGYFKRLNLDGSRPPVIIHPSVGRQTLNLIFGTSTVGTVIYPPAAENIMLVGVTNVYRSGFMSPLGMTSLSSDSNDGVLEPFSSTKDPNDPTNTNFPLHGKIMNIYFEANFLTETIRQLRDYKTASFNLFEFIKVLLNAANSSLGGVNKLTVRLDNDRVMRIYDQTSIHGIITKGDKQDAIINLYGITPNKQGSFVTDFNIKTELTNDLATIVSIGASSQGSNTLGDATGLSTWNEGLIDRFYPNKIDSLGKNNNTYALTTKDLLLQTEKELSALWLGYSLLEPFTSLIVEDEYIDEVSWLFWGSETERETRVTGMDTYPFFPPKSDYSYYVNMQKRFLALSTQYANEKYIEALVDQNVPKDSLYYSTATNQQGMIPLNIQVTMEGLSGVRIYDKLNLDTRFLPEYYPQNLYWIIKGVSHEIKNNKWYTKLDTLAYPILPPKNHVYKVLYDQPINLTKASGGSSTPPPTPPTHSVATPNADKLRSYIQSAGFISIPPSILDTSSIYGDELTSAGADITSEMADVAIAVFSAIATHVGDVNDITLKALLKNTTYEIIAGNSSYYRFNPTLGPRHTTGNAIRFKVGPNGSTDIDILDLQDKVDRILSGIVLGTPGISGYRDYTTGNTFVISPGPKSSGQWLRYFKNAEAIWNDASIPVTLPPNTGTNNRNATVTMKYNLTLTI